jgi:translocation and assembly module TamB
MSDAAPAPRRRPSPKTVGIWAGAIALGLATLVALAAIIADTGPGHRALARFVAGLAPANGLQVRVGRIEGSIYGRMVLHDLELRDPQGLFLTSPAVTVDWRPFALAGNHLSVRELSSPLVRVLRRPALIATPSAPDAPLLPSIDITVGRLDIRQIVLEAAVAGRAHNAAIAGDVDIADGRARLNLTALARPSDGVGGGDRLIVRLDAAPEADRLMIDAQLAAPVGGVVDGLANLRRPLDLRVTGAGTWAQWSGRALATLGAEQLADLTLVAQAGRFRVQGEARPAAMLGEAAGRLLSPALGVDITAEVEDRRLDTNLRLRSDALDLAGTGVLDLARSRFGDFRLQARLLRPEALLDDVRGRDVRLAVALDGPFATPQVRYDLTAAALGFGDMLVEQLTAAGRFTVGAERTVIPVSARAARVVGVDEAVGGVLRGLRLDGDVVMTADQLASDNLRIRSDALDATLVFAATLSTGQYEAALKGAINRYELPGFGLLNLNTDARLVPNGAGGFRLQGNLRAETLRIDNAALRDLLGGQAVITGVFARAPDGTFAVANLRVASPGLTVVDGRGSYAPNGAVRFNASAQSERYGPIILAVEGQAASPLVRVRLPRPNLGMPLTNVEAVLRPTEGGYVITAIGGSPYGPLNVEAALRLGQPLTVEVRRASLAGITVTGSLRQTAAGPYAGALALRGSGLTGSVRLSAAGSVQQADLDLDARNARIPTDEPILIAEGAAKATALLVPDAPSVTGNLTVSGVRQGEFRLTTGTAALTYRDNAGRLQLTGSGESGVPFTVAADAALAGDVARIDAKGTVNRIPVRLASPAELRRQGGGWRLAPTTVVLPQGQAQVAGVVGEGVRAAVRLEKLDLSILRAFAPSLGVGGVASGTLDFALPQEPAFPTGTARLTVERFTRAGVVTTPEPVDMTLVFELNPTRASANAVIRRRSAVIGRLQAQLAPIPGGGGWVDRLMAAPLSGGLRYNGPAEVLWALTGMEGQQVSGPVAIGADLSGSLGQPRTEGVVRARGLRYENQAYGTVIDNLAVEGRLSGSRLDFQSISGRAGGGTVSGSGYINLAADEGFPMDLRLQLRRARLAGSDDLAATVTGDLTVAHSQAEPARISGALVIDEARYRIVRQGAAEVAQLAGVRRRGDPPPSDGPPPVPGGLPASWRLDIAVTGDNRIFVSGMGLEAEWQASLRVTGSPERPAIAGEIRAVRGTYAFAGRRLELSRGIIRFAGESPPDPALDIQATTTVEGVTATINIGGRAQNPQIAFVSTPALPQDEVLARLLFGSSVTELTATQALQLAASLNSLRGGSGGLNPLGSLRQAAGIDRLRVFGGGEEGGGAGLAAGKYITNDVYVEITTDARGFTALQLEIALTRSLALLARTGSFGDSSVNLRYSREY